MNKRLFRYENPPTKNSGWSMGTVVVIIVIGLAIYLILRNRIVPTETTQTAQTERLVNLEESKIPTGIKIIKMTIPDTITKIPLYPPWISFSMINDGPVGAVTVWINNEEDPLRESMVASGESYNCNMDYPSINSLYLKAASGTTSAVRIYGKEGQWK